MGRVFLAQRQEGAFRRLYAIKRLLPALTRDAAARAAFLDEARLAGLLRHPNVVSVLDVGEDDEGPFLVMEYVAGRSLDKIIASLARQRTSMPLPVVAELGASISMGLHAAHELRDLDGSLVRLVHRDLSPQNVLVSDDGTLRITDFGIAKALGRAAETTRDVVKGKMGYLSPEALRFETLGARADLFSLGVVLYELLAARRLYAGPAMEVARRILDEPPPDLVDVRRDAPPDLVELLFALLAKTPQERPGTAREVAQVLEHVRAVTLDPEEPEYAADFIAALMGPIEGHSSE